MTITRGHHRFPPKKMPGIFDWSGVSRGPHRALADRGWRSRFGLMNTATDNHLDGGDRMDCVGSQGDHFPYINHITSHITRESTTYQPHVNYISTTYQWYHINHIPIFHKSTASVNHPSYSHGIGDVRQLCGLLHGDALWCVEDLKRGSGWVQKISCYLTIYLPWTLVMHQKKWFYYHGNMIIYFIISYLGFSINMATSKCICSVQWKIPLTWMIRGYPHFRKPPCKLGRNCRVYVKRVFFDLLKWEKERNNTEYLIWFCREMGCNSQSNRWFQ